MPGAGCVRARACLCVCDSGGSAHSPTADPDLKRPSHVAPSPDTGDMEAVVGLATAAVSGGAEASALDGGLVISLGSCHGTAPFPWVVVWCALPRCVPGPVAVLFQPNL